MPTPDEIRKLRASAGLTQQALADTMGVHQVTIARWETGVVPISESRLDHVRRICQPLAAQAKRKRPATPKGPQTPRETLDGHPSPGRRGRKRRNNG